jgi:phage tail-like protein
MDAFPVKWQGPDFDASANEVPTEELEIAHHGFVSVTFF